MHVLKTVSNVRSNPHPGYPRSENREIGVQFVPETIAEVRTFHEVVDQVDVLTLDGCSKEFDYAAVMTPAYQGQLFGQTSHVNGAPELPLEDRNLFSVEGGVPGRR